MADFLEKLRRRPIGDKYTLIRKLGEGAHGAVYRARDVESEEEVALKLEESYREPMLEDEYYRYTKFEDLPGFPKVYWYGEHDDFKIMAMELLGPTLEDLLAYCGGRFTLKTTLMVADQLLERLGALHKQRLVHRDIKPGNFLLGRGTLGNTIYIADFGIAMVHRPNDAEDHSGDEPNTEDDCEGLFGTELFASRRGHCPQSPRDDLESLSYMLVFFLQGELPWQRLKATSEKSVRRRLFEAKMALDVEEFFVGLPRQFASLMLMARSPQGNQPLNYGEIRNMLSEAAREAKIEYDHVYDWTTKRYLELRNTGELPKSSVAQSSRRR